MKVYIVYGESSIGDRCSCSCPLAAFAERYLAEQYAENLHTGDETAVILLDGKKWNDYKVICLNVKEYAGIVE